MVTRLFLHGYCFIERSRELVREAAVASVVLSRVQLGFERKDPPLRDMTALSSKQSDQVFGRKSRKNFDRKLPNL